MFATMRRKRRTTKMKSELGQSVDHLRRAAAIAAQETSSTVGPTLTAARDRVQPAVSSARGAASSGWGSAVATLTPLVTAAAEGVRQSGKDVKKTSRRQAKATKKNAKKIEKRANKKLDRKQGSRKGKLVGIALIGTAVGLGAAAFMGRRKAAQWDEYDPAPAQPVGADDAAFEPDPASAVAEVPSTGTPKP